MDEIAYHKITSTRNNHKFYEYKTENSISYTYRSSYPMKTPLMHSEGKR